MGHFFKPITVLNSCGSLNVTFTCVYVQFATGCGKSTLMMSMFRIMELEAGSILIDGVDISKIGLQDLRRNLCLVPQDPVIFCGSVRMNLDPFDSIREDSKIWEALRQAHMSDFVQSLEVSHTSTLAHLTTLFVCFIQ